MATFVQPTIWILSGGGIHVRYSVAGPNLHYQHHLTTKNFSGSQVRVVEVTGGLFTIARDEGHSRTFVEQRHRRSDLRGPDAEFLSDELNDFALCSV